MLQDNLVPRAFPLKNGRPTHFLREKPWVRGWLQDKCKWADGRHQNKVYRILCLFFSPRPRSVHFPRRYSFSPRSTWEPVCRLGERGHKPLCVKKNVNICRMSDWGMRFRFWPSESRASGGLAWSSTLCTGWWRIEVFCWSERNVFPISTFNRIFSLYLVGRRINWFNGNVLFNSASDQHIYKWLVHPLWVLWHATDHFFSCDLVPKPLSERG